MNVSQAEEGEAYTSRGDILKHWVTSSQETSAQTFLEEQARADDRVRGYNAIFGSIAQAELWHHSNRNAHTPMRLRPGLHALSNGKIEETWPKMSRGRSRVQALLDSIDHSGELCASPHACHPVHVLHHVSCHEPLA